MKIQLSLFFLFFTICCSCNRDVDEKAYVPIARCPEMTRNLDTITKYIQGNWEWEEEYRVHWYFQGYITPNSPDEKRRFWELNGEIARLKTEGSADSVYRFSVQKEFEVTNYPEDTLPVLVFYRLNDGLRYSYVPIKICKNQLLTQNQYVSSFFGESLWIRR